MDSAASAPQLGSLPEWNLADLYASPDDPLFAGDMRRGEDEARMSMGKFNSFSANATLDYSVSSIQCPVFSTPFPVTLSD